MIISRSNILEKDVLGKISLKYAQHNQQLFFKEDEGFIIKLFLKLTSNHTTFLMEDFNGFNLFMTTDCSSGLIKIPHFQRDTKINWVIKGI